jgi:hypothetical protein
MSVGQRAAEKIVEHYRAGIEWEVGHNQLKAVKSLVAKLIDDEVRGQKKKNLDLETLTPQGLSHQETGDDPTRDDNGYRRCLCCGRFHADDALCPDEP